MQRKNLWTIVIIPHHPARQRQEVVSWSARARTTRSWSRRWRCSPSRWSPPGSPTSSPSSPASMWKLQLSKLEPDTMLLVHFLAFLTFSSIDSRCNIQRVCFSLPLTLLTPLCLAIITPLCTYRAQDPCRWIKARLDYGGLNNIDVKKDFHFSNPPVEQHTSVPIAHILRVPGWLWERLLVESRPRLGLDHHVPLAGYKQN